MSYSHVMMLGQVDEVDGHYIATKFHALLIPTSSMYVVSESANRHLNTTTFTWSGVPVRFNWKSALLAYPRVWLWFLAFAWPFLLHYGENVSKVPSSTWMTSVGFMVLALLFIFVPGRLSTKEKNRLRLLGRVTGMRLDPTKLPVWKRESQRAFLDAELSKIGVPTTPEGLLALGQNASSETLEPLYALACYSSGNEWRAVATALLARHTEALRLGR